MLDHVNSVYDSLDSDFFSSNYDGSKINLIHINIRSMRSNFDMFIAALSKFKHKINIIVLSEIWIGSEEINLYKLPGYKLTAKCNDSYKAGGVARYVDENFESCSLDCIFNTADCMLVKINSGNWFF